MGSRGEKLLLALLLGAVLLVGLFATPGEHADESDPRLTTHRVSPHGGRALYLTLAELGVPVGRRAADWARRDSLPPVMALLAPSVSPSPGEVGNLLEWLEGGGTLLYVAGSGDPVADTLGLVLHPTFPDTGEIFAEPVWDGVEALPRPGDPLSRGTHAVEGFRAAFADSSRALRRARVLLATEEGAPVAVVFPRGRGRVVAWSDGYPFGNARLRTSGAALLFARAAVEASAGGRTVWFDEFHHGFRAGGSVTGGMRRFLADRPVGHAVLQLLFVSLLLMLAAGRRFGAPLPAPAARRRSPLEHVEALAGAYRQGGARRTARRLLLAGLARRLGRRPPRDAAAEAELLARLAAHPTAGAAGAALRDAWHRPGADLVSLTRDVDRLLEEVKRT